DQTDHQRSPQGLCGGGGVAQGWTLPATPIERFPQGVRLRRVLNENLHKITRGTRPRITTGL
ncbi:MAG: hypothetical protein V3W22_01235, partial [Thermoplasmata archaeon]